MAKKSGISNKAAGSIPFWNIDPQLLLFLTHDASTTSTIDGSSLTRGGFQYPPTPWDIVTYGTQGIPIPGLAIVRKVGKKLKLDKKGLAGTDGISSTFQGMHPLHFDFDLLLWTPEQLDTLYNQVMPVIFPGRGRAVTKTVTYAATGLGGLGNGFLNGGLGVSSALPGNPGLAGLATSFSPGSGSNSSSTSSTVVQASRQVTTGNLQIPVIMGHPALAFHKVSSVIVEDVDGPVQHAKSNDIFVLHFKCVEFKNPKNIQTTTPHSAAPATHVGQANTYAVNSASALDPQTHGGAASPVPASSTQSTTQ